MSFFFYQQRINKIKKDTSRVSQPLYKIPKLHDPRTLPTKDPTNIVLHIKVKNQTKI